MYMESWRLFLMGLYVLATAYVIVRQIETIDKLTDKLVQTKKGENK